jgi:phage shock protein A
MSLADRARTAIWSNINAIVSRLEQSSNEVPGLLEQMGQEIHKAKRELLRLMGEEKVLRERSKTSQIDAQQWQNRAELAVRKGDDSLARDALLQFRRLQGEAARDTAAADEYAGLAQAIKADILQMEQKHGQYSARKSTINTAVQQARAGGGAESLGAGPGRNPFEDLRRIERSIEGAEFATEAQQELDDLLSPGESLRREIDALPEPPAPNPPQSEAHEESLTGESPGASNTKRRVRVE